MLKKRNCFVFYEDIRAYTYVKPSHRIKSYALLGRSGLSAGDTIAHATTERASNFPTSKRWEVAQSHDRDRATSGLAYEHSCTAVRLTVISDVHEEAHKYTRRFEHFAAIAIRHSMVMAPMGEGLLVLCQHETVIGIVLQGRQKIET